MPGQKKNSKLWSQKHPLFYFLSVWQKRIFKIIEWHFDNKKYTRKRSSEKLEFRVKKHSSKLIKNLNGADLQLQYNKVENLKLAIKKIDGIIINPGETFSFCKTVGYPGKFKGYLKGMELKGGMARPGTGGGICQISNLIYWLALHSPLIVTERHHHSFDPFPDDGRILPYASGATVFYNYLDLQIKNDTEMSFQINLWLTDKALEGEIRINKELDYVYHVFEKGHKFYEENGKKFRSNELWRKKALKKGNGTILETEFIVKNKGEVMYSETSS